MKHISLFALVLAVSTASAQIHFTAALSGANEVPAVATAATATGSFVLNENRTELTYTITYQGLSGTLSAGGHFHVAKPGVNGPVVRSIATAGDPASNTISGIWISIGCNSTSDTSPRGITVDGTGLCEFPYNCPSGGRNPRPGNTGDCIGVHS